MSIFATRCMPQAMSAAFSLCSHHQNMTHRPGTLHPARHRQRSSSCTLGLQAPYTRISPRPFEDTPTAWSIACSLHHSVRFPFRTHAMHGWSCSPAASCAVLLPSHASSSGIEALPDELRESRRVQRIANVLNRKHRAAQYVAAPTPSSCWSVSQRLHPADTLAAPLVTSSLLITASLSLLSTSTHARWQIRSPILLGQNVR